MKVKLEESKCKKCKALETCKDEKKDWINPCFKLSLLELQALTLSLSISCRISRRKREFTRALQRLMENNYNSLQYKLYLQISPPFFRRVLGSLFIGFRRGGTSHPDRGINRWLNGQITAADPRPEPRFRGRILAVAPADSVANLLEVVGHVVLLEC